MAEEAAVERMEQMNNGGGGGDIRPRPDPTLLTTQQLIREIGALRETLETRMDAINTKIETRLDGMDKAIELLQSTHDKLPAKIDEKVRHLESLHDERFIGVQRQLEGVQRQFEERDVRSEQTSQAAKEAVATAFQASKEAVAAALQAAKEAVAAQNEAFSQATSKAEGATAKLLDQLSSQILLSTGGLNDKIDDVKSRLTTIEGKGSGYSASWGVGLAAIGLVGTLLGIAMLVVNLTR